MCKGRQGLSLACLGLCQRGRLPPARALPPRPQRPVVRAKEDSGHGQQLVDHHVQCLRVADPPGGLRPPRTTAAHCGHQGMRPVHTTIIAIQRWLHWGEGVGGGLARAGSEPGFGSREVMLQHGVHDAGADMSGASCRGAATAPGAAATAPGGAATAGPRAAATAPGGAAAAFRLLLLALAVVRLLLGKAARLPQGLRCGNSWCQGRRVPSYSRHLDQQGQVGRGSTGAGAGRQGQGQHRDRSRKWAGAGRQGQ